MARVVGRGRPGWVWPVVILLAVLILGVIAWALLAPSAPVIQPTETAPAPAPAVVATSIGDITGDPSSFYGKNVTLEGSINRTAGDQGLYLAGTSGGSDLLAVFDTRVADAGLRQGDFGSFSGTVREVNAEEIARLETMVDRPTRDAIANEQFYLSVSGYRMVAGDLGF